MVHFSVMGFISDGINNIPTSHIHLRFNRNSILFQIIILASNYLDSQTKKPDIQGDIPTVQFK